MMEKEKRKKWNVILILLLIVNVAFGLYVLPALFSPGGGFIFFNIIPFLIPLALIDLIAVHIYIFTQHPKRTARIVSYSVLLPLISLLAIIAFIVIDFFSRLNT